MVEKVGKKSWTFGMVLKRLKNFKCPACGSVEFIVSEVYEPKQKRFTVDHIECAKCEACFEPEEL